MTLYYFTNISVGIHATLETSHRLRLIFSSNNTLIATKCLQNKMLEINHSKKYEGQIAICFTEMMNCNNNINNNNNNNNNNNK